MLEALEEHQNKKCLKCPYHWSDGMYSEQGCLERYGRSRPLPKDIDDKAIKFAEKHVCGNCCMKCGQLNAGRPKWHKLDWKQDYPKLDRLVRVRTQNGEEYICETYAYQPTEDEIGYGTILTQFEQLNGDWVDDNEIEYWCYIEPFKE